MTNWIEVYGTDSPFVPVTLRRMLLNEDHVQSIRAMPITLQVVELKVGDFDERPFESEMYFGNCSIWVKETIEEIESMLQSLPVRRLT